MSTQDTRPQPPGSPRALAVLLVGATLALAWVLLPFAGAMLWGAILALLFAPWYRWMLPHLGRHRTPAAVLTLALVLLIVILPLLAVLASLASELSQLYGRVQTGEVNPARYFREAFVALPDWLRDVLARFGLINFNVLLKRLDAALAQGGQPIAAQAFSIGLDTFDFVVGLFIALYLAFFFIRDGDELARQLRGGVPLAPAHTQELLDRFSTVVRATVKGNLLVAAIQGALGGLAFWALDVGAALLWGALMACLSLLPAVGAALVWAPVAIYFLLTGAVWQGLGLAVYGVLVIGLVDNLLRPMLVGRDTQLPDWLVMLSTLGGLAVFGLNGFVLGPAVAAMFVAVWHIHLAPPAASA
jgi:predicted PurR-regulated permease PerM